MNRDLNDKLVNACAHNELAKVKMLLKLGANIRIRNDEALFWAAKKGHLEIVKFLLISGSYVHPIFINYAEKNGFMDVFQVLKEHERKQYG